MWRSRLVTAARFRRSSRLSCITGASSTNIPINSSSAGVYYSVFVPDEDDKRLDQQKTLQQLQRRHLSSGSGRRHGWKGKNEDDKGKKKNFAEEYLEPAARGELKNKHSSGIPNLAARKSKGHSIQGDIPGDNIDDLEQIDEMMTDAESDTEDGSLVTTMDRDILKAREEKKNRQASGGAGGRGGGGGGGRGGKNSLTLAGGSKKRKEVISVGFDNGRSPEYWKEDDYDKYLVTEEDKAMAREMLGLDGSTELEDSDQIGLMGYDDIGVDLDALDAEESDEEGDEDDDDVEDNDKAAAEADKDKADQDDKDQAKKVPERGRKGRGGRRKRGGDDDDDDDDIPDKMMDVISPLKDEGDLWKALKYHPTQYAEVRFRFDHPESKREPRPYYPKNRNNPPAGILDFFRRWMYVTGLPPALREGGIEYGGEASLTTLQEQEIQKTVTRLLGVSFDQVFPANATSAFVGFESAEGRDLILMKGPKESDLSRPITISLYTPSEDEKKRKFFVGSSPGATLLLENIPPEQLFRDTFVRELFPEGSDLGAAYPASSYKVTFPSPTTALVQFDSDERAQSAFASDKVAKRLEELGSYPVRLFRARRNLVHQRMDKTSAEDREVRAPGDKLIVDGDMPSKRFFQSHAGTIMLRNLDRDSVSKASITELFQPFSGTFRDEQGSVEFVECQNGLPTDRAYVGFDRLGEAEAAMQAFGGYAQIGDTRVTMKFVKDRGMPGLPKRVARPERTEEELLKSLNDWEQYVDPEDIKYLEENGVAKVFIDEALRGMRYQNRSFGALDWAMRDEKLEPEKESGDDYKELVQMYIETLKECVATPEDPGELYVGLHFPGEPIDLSVFEMEKKRQKELLKKRGL